MYNKAFKNICQVSVKCFVLSAFLVLLLSGGIVFAETPQEGAYAAIERLVEISISSTKAGALQELTDRFPDLYNPKSAKFDDPANASQRKIMKDAVDALIDDGRTAIYNAIKQACDMTSADIAQCLVSQTAAKATSQAASLLIKNFEDVRTKSALDFAELLVATEADTTKKVAAIKIEANIAELTAARAALVAESASVDKYIAETEESISTAGILNGNLRGFFLNEINAGLNVLRDERRRISATIRDVDRAIIDLTTIKWRLENGRLNPDDVDKLFLGVKNNLLLIRVDIQGIIAMLDNSDLKWLIRKYNELHPEKPVDLNKLKAGIGNQLAPLVAAMNNFNSKEFKDDLDKLKTALAIPESDPRPASPNSPSIVIPTIPAGSGPRVGDPFPVLFNSDGGRLPCPNPATSAPKPKLQPRPTAAPSQPTVPYYINWPLLDGSAYDVYEYLPSVPMAEALKSPSRGRKIRRVPISVR
ncbi:MAG: hypothetical protein Q7R63_00695 [bacterium]|nr:hypothetical protein [bacterium]